MSLYPLSAQQTAIYAALVAAVRQRRQDRSASPKSMMRATVSTTAADRSERQTGLVVHDASQHGPVQQQDQFSADWHTIRVILGKAGTGKSQVLIRVVHNTVFGGCSSGLVSELLSTSLCRRSRRQPTPSSVFNIPVANDNADTINFTLSRYDLIVIDEASMISRPTFDKIATTLCALPKRPVLVIAGDKVQQQPIGSKDGRIVQLVSILNDDTLRNNTITYVLNRQFRCLDASYAAFMDHLRYWQPNQQFLDRIQDGCVVEGALQLTDDTMWQAITQEPNTTVLTVSREGADHINRVVLHRLFQHMTPISNIPCQGRFCTFPVYNEMKVLITENRDKDSGFVNGQRATVTSSQNNTVLLTLPNKKTLFTHPISKIDQQGYRHVSYPFTPGYSVTICKTRSNSSKSYTVVGLPTGTT